MTRAEAIKVLQSKLHLDCSVNMAVKELEAREVAITALREQEQREWISVKERLPTREENSNGLVGIVNGYNGRIKFADALIFVSYDFGEKDWYSDDYDLTDCKVEYWYAIPELPKED